MEERNNLIAKAKKLEKGENFESALKILEDLFEKDRDSTDVKSALIDVLLSYGGHLNDDLIMGFDKAFKCFQKIIEIDPLNYRAYYNLGIVYLNLGKMKEALIATNKALEIKPDHKYSYYNLGLIY